MSELTNETIPSSDGTSKKEAKVAEETKAPPAPPMGPLVLKAPPAHLSDLLAKFAGNRTPATFAAAKRQQAHGSTIKVPRHLLCKLWDLTGGWKELEVVYEKWMNPKKSFPVRFLKDAGLCGYTTQKVDGKDVKVPVRNFARVTRVGELELCFSQGNLFLRWRRWIVARVTGWNVWVDENQLKEFREIMTRPMTPAEADDWGFMTAEEVAKK